EREVLTRERGRDLTGLRDPGLIHRDEHHGERHHVGDGEADVRPAHARALRAPAHARNATRRTAGTMRRDAAIHHTGVTGWTDGSPPSGSKPSVGVSSDCGLSSNAVLRAAVGTASRKSDTRALAPMAAYATARVAYECASAKP